MCAGSTPAGGTIQHLTSCSYHQGDAFRHPHLYADLTLNTYGPYDRTKLQGLHGENAYQYTTECGRPIPDGI